MVKQGDDIPNFSSFFLQIPFFFFFLAYMEKGNKKKPTTTQPPNKKTTKNLRTRASIWVLLTHFIVVNDGNSVAYWPGKMLLIKTSE